MVTAIRFLILVLMGFSSLAFGLRLIPMKKQWGLEMKSPVMATLCQGKLWVWSYEDRAFHVIVPSEGREVLRVSPKGLGTWSHLSAVTCLKEQLFLSVVTNRSEEKSFLAKMEFTGKLNLELRKRVMTPLGRGRVTAMDCQGGECWVIQEGEVFRGKGEGSWKKMAIPQSREIPHKSHNLEENPFEDLQDKLTLARGRYIKLSRFDHGAVALLDPFRSSVVMVSPPGFDQPIRVGQWGVWEGGFYAPKSILAFGANSLVVSDPVLKAIFLFDRTGQYLGTLGEGDRILEFQYASEILRVDDQLIVLDWLGGRVSSWTRALAPSKEISAPNRIERVSLYRREIVKKSRAKEECLLCHDGSMTDELSKFLPGLVHHPIGVEKVACGSCHDPHHPKAKKGDPPHFLRKEASQLCTSCHENHDQKGAHPKVEGQLCTACHKAHEGHEGLLKQDQKDLCLNCHREQKFRHPSVEHLMKTEDSAGLSFLQNEIACLTCHNPHQAMVQKVGQTPKILPFCGSCHGGKTEDLYSRFHVKMKTRKGANP